MKVRSVKGSEVIDGPEVWRKAFPIKGCTHKAADAEAAARIMRDIDTVGGSDRQRLVDLMVTAGTFPDSLDTYVEKPKPEKIEAVPERSAIRSDVKSELKGK